MVGHYLMTLTPEQEDRILTEPMRHFPNSNLEQDTGARCLVMVAWGLSTTEQISMLAHRTGWVRSDARHSTFVTARYDALCDRFGVECINTAIRNRILSNQARRALTGVRETVEM